MEYFLTSCLIATVVILLAVWIHSMKRGKRSIPGPLGFPIVGYLPLMTKKPYEKLVELSKTYGPIYKIRMGMRDVLILSDFESIKKAFQDESFMGRPYDLPSPLTKTTVRTGAFLGKEWKVTRNLIMSMLRTFGSGRTIMEDSMQQEIMELLEILQATNGSIIKIDDLLSRSISNNIASIVFGRRMGQDDPKRVQLTTDLKQIDLIAQSLSWQFSFPPLRALLEKFQVGNWGKLLTAVDRMNRFMAKEINEHEQTLDPNNIRDFIDAYLLEMEAKKNDYKISFHKDILMDVSRGMFGAGSGTVRFSVEWMLLLAAGHPDLQKKMQEEIDNTLGSEAFPTGQDQQRMPYVNAAIQEMWRWTSMVPLNIMRYTLRETELKGYIVPKNMHVMAVFYGINKSREVWGADAHEYKPERFLSKDGRNVENLEYAITFSIGRRACPAKALGKLEVFLYVVAILKAFHVSPPPGCEIDFEGVLGVGLIPKPQDLLFTPR